MTDEQELVIPAELAQLVERIRTGLPEFAAEEWLREFLSALRSSPLPPRKIQQDFLAKILADQRDGALAFTTRDKTRKAVVAVAALHREERSDQAVWKQATTHAWSAVSGTGHDDGDSKAAMAAVVAAEAGLAASVGDAAAAAKGAAAAVKWVFFALYTRFSKDYAYTLLADKLLKLLGAEERRSWTELVGRQVRI